MKIKQILEELVDKCGDKAVGYLSGKEDMVDEIDTAISAIYKEIEGCAKDNRLEIQGIIVQGLKSVNINIVTPRMIIDIAKEINEKVITDFKTNLGTLTKEE